MKNTCLILSLFFSTFTFANDTPTKSFTANKEIKSSINHLDLRNAKIYQQRLITGGQPSVNDLTRLKNKVELIINLRSEGEFTDFDEPSKAAALGVKYLAIPVASSNDLNKKNIALFHQAIKSEQGNILVHCASSNRVGAFFALEAFYYHNKTPEQALAIGKQTGLASLSSTVMKIMNQQP